MGKDSFLIEGPELIPDIEFEHSRMIWSKGAMASKFCFALQKV